MAGTWLYQSFFSQIELNAQGNVGTLGRWLQACYKSFWMRVAKPREEVRNDCTTGACDIHSVLDHRLLT